MAKELRFAPLAEEPDESERPTHPMIEMRRLQQRTEEPRHERGPKEFSLASLEVFQDRASVMSRVLSRALNSHRAGASARDLGKELRGAQLKLHGEDISVSRPMVQIAKALEAASKLTAEGMNDVEASQNLYIALDNVADIPPGAFEKFLNVFDEKMGSVIANMKQRKQQIAEAVKRPSKDLATLMQETDAMEAELMEINQDVPVASKFRHEFSKFRGEIQLLRDAALQEIKHRQLKEAA